MPEVPVSEEDHGGGVGGDKNNAERTDMVRIS